MIDDATRLRWAREREEDARQLVAIRDTLALISPESMLPARRARVYARQAEGMAECIDGELARYLSCCPKCEELDAEVRLGDRWTVRCRACGWTASGETMDEAADSWNGEGSE